MSRTDPDQPNRDFRPPGPSTRRRSWFSLGVVTVAAACASSGSPERIEDGEPVSFELLHVEAPPVQDTDARPLQEMADQADEWSDIWSDLFGPESPAPEVDFARWRVAVVALDTRPTGGIVVAVDRVVETTTLVQVQAVETVPGPDCMTIQALTRPVSFTLIPRSPKPVEFVLERRVESCGAP